MKLINSYCHGIDTLKGDRRVPKISGKILRGYRSRDSGLLRWEIHEGKEGIQELDCLFFEKRGGKGSSGEK